MLVAQDTTAYGRDLGMRDGLPALVERLAADVPEAAWIRIMYAYPGHISRRLLQMMASTPQVCHDLDVPLQHTHPAVLRRMRRPHEGVEDLVARIRDAVPEVAIRTTFIVGFPGETEEEHRHLLRSIDRMGFDHVGVFAYSPQRGTPAAAETDQVAERTRRRRWREAMEVAQRVSLRQNRKMVGRELQVLVEGAGDARGGRALTMVGRSYRDAPEVDGLVFFSGSAWVGEMVRVRITSALQYDLIGEMVGRDRCEVGDGGTRGRAEGGGSRGAASSRRAAERVVGAGQRHVGG